MDGLSLATDMMRATVQDGIATMTYNNPARHNAVNHEMRLAIIDILAAFAADPGVRVVVIAGAGGKAFVSGADISEFDTQRSTPEQIEDYRWASRRVEAAYAALDKPLIAMIRGYCLGGGLNTALNAGIRIAAEGAKFGIPAARLGLGFGFDSVAKLVSIVGPANAAEILYTAERFSAAEALQMGLVNRVVAEDALESTVRKMATAIAANAPLTVLALTVSLAEAVKDPALRDAAKCARLIEACMASEDYVEGRRAFREKRPPVFTGR